MKNKTISVDVFLPEKDKNGLYTVMELVRFAIQITDPTKSYFNFLVSVYSKCLFSRSKITDNEKVSLAKILKVYVLPDFEKKTGIKIEV